MTLEIAAGKSYILPNYFDTAEISSTDNWTGPIIVVSQTPHPGTELSAGSYTIEIIVNEFASGLYLIKIATEQSSIVKRIVKK